MRVALAQITSGPDPTANLELVKRYAVDARDQGATLVIFPEATMCAFGNQLASVAEPLDGPWATAVRGIAVELQISIVAGMFTPGDSGRVRNTLLVTGPGADTHYDKIHLFDAFGYAESDNVDAGNVPVTFDIGGTTFGLATCYDVRFPALFTHNARAGAHVNIVCASWGAGEGKKEQWDLLLRARAVDSTTFVLACGQAQPGGGDTEPVSTAPTGIGYSACVSPLGTEITSLGAGPELAIIDINTASIDEIRTKLPVLANARAL